MLQFYLFNKSLKKAFKYSKRLTIADKNGISHYYELMLKADDIINTIVVTSSSEEVQTATFLLFACSHFNKFRYKSFSQFVISHFSKAYQSKIFLRNMGKNGRYSIHPSYDALHHSNDAPPPQSIQQGCGSINKKFTGSYTSGPPVKISLKMS